MYDTSDILRARSVFAEKRTIDRTHLFLKEERAKVGKKPISKNTLKYWRADYEWDKYLEELDKKAREYDEIKRNMEQNLLVELVQEKDELRKKIKDKPEDSQLRHNYTALVDRILKLSGMDTETGSIDEIYSEIMDAIMQDPVAGKVLASRKEIILKRLLKNGK